MENLKWVDTTPIFDTGESLECNKDIYQMNFVDGVGKFFNDIEKKFSKIIEYIDLSNYNFTTLYGIDEEITNKFKDTQIYTNISDERINKIVSGLTSRIANVQNLQRERR